ncbi:MAG: hypothetical protein AAF193_12045, partial [Bacteroidota bacterium]
ELLQKDLNSVYNWSEINNMSLNGLKFEHMQYGKNEELKYHIQFIILIPKVKSKLKAKSKTLELL